VTLAELQRANREDPQQYPSGAVISTRVVLDIARRIQTCNTTPRDAVLSTLKAQFDPGDEAALSILVDSQYPVMVEIEDDSVTEISPEVLRQEADRLANEATERAQQAAAAGNLIDEADRVTMHGQFICTSCGRNVQVTLESCNWCGTPNPIITGLAAAANSAPKPMITVARHFFVARGLDGQLTTACQHRADSTTDKVCGRERRHSIHHD
jgi:hypothetical protein